MIIRYLDRKGPYLVGLFFRLRRVASLGSYGIMA